MAYNDAISEITFYTKSHLRGIEIKYVSGASERMGDTSDTGTSTFVLEPNEYIEYSRIYSNNSKNISRVTVKTNFGRQQTWGRANTWSSYKEVTVGRDEMIIGYFGWLEGRNSSTKVKHMGPAVAKRLELEFVRYEFGEIRLDHEPTATVSEAIMGNNSSVAQNRTVQLNYQNGGSATDSFNKNETLTQGWGLDVKIGSSSEAGGGVSPVKTSSTVEATFKYSGSFSESTTWGTSDTETFNMTYSENVSTEIAPYKGMLATLTVMRDTASIPYSAIYRNTHDGQEYPFRGEYVETTYSNTGVKWSEVGEYINGQFYAYPEYAGEGFEEAFNSLR